MLLFQQDDYHVWGNKIWHTYNSMVGSSLVPEVQIRARLSQSTTCSKQCHFLWRKRHQKQKLSKHKVRKMPNILPWFLLTSLNTNGVKITFLNHISCHVVIALSFWTHITIKNSSQRSSKIERIASVALGKKLIANSGATVVSRDTKQQYLTEEVFLCLIINFVCTIIVSRHLCWFFEGF